MYNNKKIKKYYKKKIYKTFKLIKSYINSKIQINIKVNIGKEIKIKNQKIENIEFKKDQIININIYKNNKKCNFICNNFKKKTILKFIKYFNNTIDFISKDKYNKLPSNYLFKKKYKKNLGLIFNDHINTNNIINLCKNIELNSLNYNKNILSDGVIFQKYKYYNFIYNNYNLMKYYLTQDYIIINNIFYKKSNNMTYNTKYIHKHKLLDLIHFTHKLPIKTYKGLINKLNPKKIKTKIYSVIFTKEITSEIFYYLYKSIKASNIYNKTSFMLNKLNKKILPKWINIIENPYLYKGIGSKPFDNEGLNTKKYTIIKNGILKTWISNYKWSKKLNIKNTFNSGGIHNWCFIKNKYCNITFKNLIKKIKNGIIINNLLGQGININNGLFSKGASGFLIKNKKIKYPIHEITISGNLIKLFKNIKYMSNDINENSKIRTGSILVSNIQVAGK